MESWNIYTWIHWITAKLHDENDWLRPRHTVKSPGAPSTIDMIIQLPSNMLTFFVLVSWVFAYTESSLWASEFALMCLPRETVTDCSEEPNASSDSLHSVGGKRRRESDMASGPPYVYLIFQLGPICRACGSLALHAPFQTPQIAVSQLHNIQGQDFSQMPSLF